MLDADAVINNSSQKVGRSNAYPDPAPKKWVGSDPEKHMGSTPLDAAKPGAMTPNFTGPLGAAAYRVKYGTTVCRYNWHSAGSLGWPFPTLKYK